ARTEPWRMNRWRAEIPMTRPFSPQVSFSLSSRCPAAVVVFVNCRCRPCNPQGRLGSVLLDRRNPERTGQATDQPSFCATEDRVSQVGLADHLRQQLAFPP